MALNTLVESLLSQSKNVGIKGLSSTAWKMSYLLCEAIKASRWRRRRSVLMNVDVARPCYTVKFKLHLFYQLSTCRGFAL